MAFYHGLIDDEVYDFGKQFCDYSFFYFNLTNDMIRGCRENVNTFNKYVQPANPWDIYAKCPKKQPINCIYSDKMV